MVQTVRTNELKSKKYLSYVIRNIDTKNIDSFLSLLNKLPRELLVDNLFLNIRINNPNIWSYSFNL